MKTVAVIPARYQSSRMPGKPLADILGKPMIWWVYKEAEKCAALDGVLIANTQQIMPMPVITGAAQYPQGLEETLRSVCKNAWIVDALTPAEEAGSPKAVNVVLMGLLSRMLGIPEEAWEKAMEACIKPALLPLNQKAFQSGRALFGPDRA